VIVTKKILDERVLSPHIASIISPWYYTLCIHPLQGLLFLVEFEGRRISLGRNNMEGI